MVRLIGVAFAAYSLFIAQVKACDAQLASHQGVWALQDGADACPASLELRCLDLADGGSYSVFVDEITTDGTPGAQIYFSNVNDGVFSFPNDFRADTKERATYDPKKDVLVDLYKRCHGVLGCWGLFDVRHQIHFADNQLFLDVMWNQSSSCSYDRKSLRP